MYRRVTDPWTRYRWRKTITYITLVIGVLVIGREWLEGFKSLATFLGLVSAGIAISLKDPLTNLAGWAFIVWRRPFEVGDRIEIAKHKGDVIDIRLFQFTLNEIGVWVDADQSTGRIVHIPNQLIFTEPVANYDKGFRYIWNEVPVVVTFESNWKKAKEILTAIAFKHAEHLTADAERDLLAASQQFLINYKKLTPIVPPRHGVSDLGRHPHRIREGQGYRPRLSHGPVVQQSYRRQDHRHARRLTECRTGLHDGADQLIEVIAPAAVVRDRNTQRKLPVENGLRGNGQPALLNAEENLLVQRIQCRVIHPRHDKAETHHVEWRRREQLEPRMLRDKPGEIVGLAHVLVDQLGERIQAVRLERHPDLQGAESA